MYKDKTRCNNNLHSMLFSISQYEKIEMLFHDLDNWLMRQDDRESQNYQDYVNSLLDKYKKRVEKILINKNEGNNALLEQINDNINKIKSIINNYLDSNILQSIQDTKTLVTKNKGGCVTDTQLITTWYRGRIFSNLDYLRNSFRLHNDWKPSAKEMGILPYDKEEEKDKKIEEVVEKLSNLISTNTPYITSFNSVNYMFSIYEEGSTDFEQFYLDEIDFDNDIKTEILNLISNEEIYELVDAFYDEV